MTLPADITLLGRAVRHLGPQWSGTERLDAAAVLLTVGGGQLVWLAVRLRRHRSRQA